jgi:hypothetical protein
VLISLLLLLLLLQVADQVMWQAASFPNAVEPLAEVLKLPNPLTMDVLTYMVRRHDNNVTFCVILSVVQCSRCV